MQVREANDLSRWFKFFLTGIIETAQKGITTFDGILRLQKETDTKIQSLGSRAVNAQKVDEYLYQRPVLNAENVKEITAVSMPSAYNLIKDLETMGILKEITGGQRSRVYEFTDYLNLFRS